MVRDFKAPRSLRLVSSARYFLRYQMPDLFAGLALLVLLVLLPIVAALL